MNDNDIVIHPIAYIRTDFATKFGIPRQSGLVPSLTGRIVFEPPSRTPEAVRGIEGYSHLWLLWQFSANVRPGESFSPTVRPPRLGGNVRMGVFATRSPFRPNNIGLSCVELGGVDYRDPEGPVLLVRGADLMDGTPILDIKPYATYSDCHPEARGGFTDTTAARTVRVECPDELLDRMPADKREALLGILEQDPRPSYQDDPERVYGFVFAGREIRFRVSDGVLTVAEIE